MRSAHHLDLVWNPGKKIVYYQAPPDLSSRKIKGRYRGSNGRIFDSEYVKKIKRMERNSAACQLVRGVGGLPPERGHLVQGPG